MKNKPKRVFVAVTNDLSTDQRVARTCESLVNIGFDVFLAGRKLKHSLSLNNRKYKCKRMRLLFVKGPLFYAEFNFRLLILQLFSRFDLIVANDLDTLPASFLAAKIKMKPLVYDSHEYYTGVPELADRPRVRAIWKWLERNIFPHLKDVITVNDSIADLYKNEYGIDITVIRNVPSKKVIPEGLSRKMLGLPEDKRICVLQGAGININRGAEEAVLSMKYTDDVIVLMIIGGGDVLPVLKKIVAENNLQDKVIFIPKQLPENLIKYTSVADIGLTLDKDTNINYRFSLPNKLFDYIHAGIPVLASRLPEVEKIILRFNIGEFIEKHDPEHIAGKIQGLFIDKESFLNKKKNTIIAAEELCWENEVNKFNYVFKKFI